MGIEVLANQTGYMNVALAVNYESAGIMFGGMILVFFMVALFSTWKFGQNMSVWSSISISAAAAIIPTVLLSTQRFNGEPSIKVWVFLFLAVMVAVGIMGERFTKNATG